MGSPDHTSTLWRRILRALAMFVGFLTIGALVGAGAGWFIVDELAFRTGTSRLWSVPGREETWKLFGTIAGGVVGSVLGMIAEIVGSIRRQRNAHDRQS